MVLHQRPRCVSRMTHPGGGSVVDDVFCRGNVPPRAVPRPAIRAQPRKREFQTRSTKGGKKGTP